MANQRVDQVCFVQGQLDPRVQTRTDWADYYKSAKSLNNCIVIPQGGVTRRWGTTYVDACITTNENFLELSVFKYNADATYLLRWEAQRLYIYLENILIDDIATQYMNEDIASLRFTQVQNRLIISTGNYQNQQLTRVADVAANITAFSALNNTLTAVTGYAAGLVLPVQFATTGNLPVTFPQIFVQRDYFIKTIGVDTFQVFSTSADAVAGINAYIITTAGVNSTLIVQNTWAIANIAFKFVPSYDFNGNYFTFTFTPSAVSGNAVTITCSNALYTAALVGGVFEGNGGSLRITGVGSPTVLTGYTVEPFANTTVIQGAVAFLGEPAWSAARGWPSVATFIQSRLVMANTPSLTSEGWLSVINDFYNFDDTLQTADYTINFTAASGDPTVIQSMTSTRSLVVHTVTGNYSTPVQSEAPLTPLGTSLIEQNKYGVSLLQPVFIDNQLFFVDGSSNSIINMIWEFAQSSYVTNNISIKASELIRNPIDMAAFTEPEIVDGFYVIFVNSDGSLCILQTLHEENILAFSPATTNTYPTNDLTTGFDTLPSSYVKVASTQNRCWFGVKRELPAPQAAIAITNFNPLNNNFLVGAPLVLMPVGVPTRIQFTTTGVLPLTTPTIAINTYYWGVAVNDTRFILYGNETDAINGTNPYLITNIGNNSNVVSYPLLPSIWIEEVNFSVYTDASKTITNVAPETVITGLDHLNGQVVQVVGNDYVLANELVINGQITIERASSVVTVGLQYISTFVPLPPVVPGLPGMLYSPNHIRNLYISYFQTIGATVQGYGIPIQTMQQVVLNAPAVPGTGTWEYTPMQGWAGANAEAITISQALPLPMTILSLSYILDI